MSSPLSKSIVPPQPVAAEYPIQDLWLFKTYTRDTYRAEFGIEAPPWDSTRLTKSWFDSTVDISDPGNVAVYKIAGTDQNGNGCIKQMVIPALEAATVNLTGAILYPAYVVAPTDATRGGQPINPSYLSLQADAQALMTQLGGTGLADAGIGGLYPIVYPPDEPRRMWYFLLNGQVQYGGLMLMSMNALGIGSPGQWTTSAGQPVWTPATPPPTGLNDTRAPRSMTVRDLLPNEAFQTGLMGIVVVRTDLQQVAAQASGQFTADDRATLLQIYQIVSALR